MFADSTSRLCSSTCNADCKLYKDPSTVEKLLNDQKELINIYKRYTFDEMKSVLQNHLSSLQGESEQVSYVENNSTTMEKDIDGMFDDVEF